MMPHYFKWTADGVMRPLNIHAAAKQYAVGETYRLVVEEDRSINSERHLFAEVEEAWKHLPHDLAEQFPTPDHLRKRALIDAGYYHQEIIDCADPAAAQRVAAYAKRRDVYALITVAGSFVVIRHAKSQSRGSMKKAEFQESKTAVLEIVSALVGVSPAKLTKNAGRAA